MTSERAALLIADIGGYTEYMSSHRMTLAHAEVNTARMLERMIEAARGFDLVEIEGDAAFLSRTVGQARPRHHRHRHPPGRRRDASAFHLEREYVAKNLCPCGGCKQAGNLKLKFVAHVGDVATQNIRGRTKLVGIDVILVHRLLKNSVSIPEYVLLSEELYSIDQTSLPDTRARDLAGPRGDRNRPRVLRRRRGPRRLAPAAARAVLACATGQHIRGGGSGPAVHARPEAASQGALHQVRRFSRN